MEYPNNRRCAWNNCNNKKIYWNIYNNHGLKFWVVTNLFGLLSMFVLRRSTNKSRNNHEMVWGGLLDERCMNI